MNIGKKRVFQILGIKRPNMGPKDKIYFYFDVLGTLTIWGFLEIN